MNCKGQAVPLQALSLPVLSCWSGWFTDMQPVPSPWVLCSEAPVLGSVICFVTLNEQGALQFYFASDFAIYVAGLVCCKGFGLEGSPGG